jgi:hypothetical protein
MDIKKKEIITIKLVKTNTYGDLEFTDTQGTPYKIGKTRANNFPAIQENATVELIWVDNPHRKDSEYIYSATKLEDKDIITRVYKEATQKPVQPTLDSPQSKSAPITPQSNTTTLPKPDIKPMTPADWDAKEARTRKSIERQKALELATGFIPVNGEMTTDAVIEMAKRFEKYLELGE